MYDNFYYQIFMINLLVIYINTVIIKIVCEDRIHKIVELCMNYKS